MTNQTKKIEHLTAHEAIACIHAAWASRNSIDPNTLSGLTRVITRAAIINQDQAAINWLFLLNWKPQQMVN